uniref:Uncharacterized protein n=1 Tax=Arundo donax TaxID=35708 RepID=A0A0A9HGT1_ARUDO
MFSALYANKNGTSNNTTSFFFPNWYDPAEFYYTTDRLSSPLLNQATVLFMCHFFG